MICQKEESLLDINKIKYFPMKVRASVKKRTDDCKLYGEKGVCMLSTKKILSLNNVKDNYLFFEKISLWL